MGPTSHTPAVGSKRSSPSDDDIETLDQQAGRSDDNEAHSEDSSFEPLEGERTGDAKKEGKPKPESESPADKSEASERAVRRRTSRFCGVCSANRKNQWQARILMKGKVTHLGYFDTEEQAARVYDVVSLSLHKDKANTNFPLSDYTSGAEAERVTKLGGLSREDLQKALGVKPIRKTSRFNGVSKKRGKWVAKVMIDKKLVYHASFHDEREAALAYDAAVRRLKPSKAHAYVNFVEPAPGDIANINRMAMGNGTVSAAQMPFQPQQMMTGLPHQQMMGGPQHLGLMGIPPMTHGAGAPVQAPNSMHLQWPVMGHMPYHSPLEPHLNGMHDQGMMAPLGMPVSQARSVPSGSAVYSAGPDMFDMDVGAPSVENLGQRGKAMQGEGVWPVADPSMEWWRNHHPGMTGYPAGSMPPPHMTAAPTRPHHLPQLAPGQHPMWSIPMAQHTPIDAFSRRENLRSHVQGLVPQPNGMMESMYNERQSSSASTWSAQFPMPNMGGLAQGDADSSFASRRTAIPAWA
eukprot:jgi/Tetstr1/465285/TSEL_009986.t1